MLPKPHITPFPGDKTHVHFDLRWEPPSTEKGGVIKISGRIRTTGTAEKAVLEDRALEAAITIAEAFLKATEE